MKKIYLISALTFALYAASPSVSAIGVPTLDATTAAILTTNALAQAKQALDALKQAKEGIDQAKAEYDAHKKLISGNSKLANLAYNPELNKLFPFGEWADIYKEAKRLPELRKRYGLVSDIEYTQKVFDKILVTTGVLEDQYEASQERVKNAEELRHEIDKVETPQQKQDLQIRYQQELLEQQNQQMQLANMLALMEQRQKAENKRRAQEFQEHMRGKGKYRSVSEMDKAYDEALDNE
ncbi:type IV secretion system protein [Pseudomonas fluorescens]|uniref:Conjugal transfer protein n=1 Tax=Pseudomonas fluorescens TaxID=294 RepID=A0A2T0HMZ4_PSEFL|nr:type IV secretion system protein [Pseudomonas fluorescens]PRW84469.1 conjugal transfer protein [Pseudomonas fluorescens]